MGKRAKGKERNGENGHGKRGTRKEVNGERRGTKKKWGKWERIKRGTEIARNWERGEWRKRRTTFLEKN